MDEIGIVLSERKNTGFALWSLLNIEIMDRDRERRRCIVVGQRRRSMPLERKDDRSTCRMQERVFDNALPISAAYVIAGLNRSIIRAHWSGPRLFLSAEEYPRYVISVRGIVIMYFVWNTTRIDIRWIELMGFAYDSLFLPWDEGRSWRSRGKWMERRELFYRRFSTVGHFTRADFNLISFSKREDL